MQREALTALGKAHEQARCVPRRTNPKAHPLVQRLLQEMHDQKVPYELMCRRAGVSFWAVRKWRRGQIPEVSTLEACLNVVGLSLAVRRHQ